MSFQIFWHQVWGMNLYWHNTEQNSLIWSFGSYASLKFVGAGRGHVTLIWSFGSYASLKFVGADRGHVLLQQYLKNACWPCDLDLEVWPYFKKLESWLLFSDGCRPASVFVFWQLLYISSSFESESIYCCYLHMVAAFLTTLVPFMEWNISRS